MKMRVAHAKRRYKNKVYSTPLVVTSYRDEKGIARNKTLANLSKLPDFIVRLVEEGLKSGDTDLLDQYVRVTDVTADETIEVGPAFVVLSILEQLGIYEQISEHLPPKQTAAVLSILVERVTSGKPLSVMAQQRVFPEEGLAFLLNMDQSPALNTWYAALARLEKNREAILKNLFDRNQVATEVFLYDITSSYFEGDSCPLGAYGYNRDGKKGKKQVVIGAICDEEGCPIWVDVFKGNTSDQDTVRQELLTLKEKLGVQKFTFVGDRGMITNARIEELEQEGWWESFQYITALKRKEMMGLIEDETHPIQLDLFDHQNLSEVCHNGERYVLCHNPMREQQDGETRERLLAKTEEKLKNIEKNVLAGRYKKRDVIAKRLHRWDNRWKMARFFDCKYDERKFQFQRREDEIARYKRLDGCYVIRSNVSRSDHGTSELRDRYKDLKFVEQAFRTMKTTDIQARPIRHFCEPQVRGHIFACFLAYRVIWEIRQRLAPVLERDCDTQRCDAGSLAEVWRHLRKIEIVKLQANGKTYLKMTSIKAYAKRLLKMCKTPTLKQILSE